MNTKLLLLITFSLLINDTFACFGRLGNTGSSSQDPNQGGGSGGGDKEPGGGDVGGTDQTSATQPPGDDGLVDALKNTEPYKSDPFQAQRGPGLDTVGNGGVTDPGKLTCDFEGECCWDNVELPEDESDWRLSRTPLSDQVWQQYIGNVEKPKGNYLITANANSPTQEAAFVSCTIKCAQEDIIVGLNYALSDGVKMKVCTQQVDANGAVEPKQYIECMELPGQFGPSVATLKPGKRINIVIVAYNFAKESAGLAILDDLFVDFTPCPEDGTTTTPTPGGGSVDEADQLNCLQVACNFNDGSQCGYKDAAEIEADRGAIPERFQGKLVPFDLHSGPFGNPVTGIYGAPDADSNPDSKYAAAELTPIKRYAAIVTDAQPVSVDRVLRFNYYEATNGVIGRVCFDNVESCSAWSSKESSTPVADRNWKTASVKIPPNTKKIYIGTHNKADDDTNVGYFGFDNLQYLKPDASGDPEKATESPCTGKSRLALRQRRIRQLLLASARRFARQIPQL